MTSWRLHVRRRLLCFSVAKCERATTNCYNLWCYFAYISKRLARTHKANCYGDARTTHMFSWWRHSTRRVRGSISNGGSLFAEKARNQQFPFAPNLIQSSRAVLKNKTFSKLMPCQSGFDFHFTPWSLYSVMSSKELTLFFLSFCRHSLIVQS